MGSEVFNSPFPGHFQPSTPQNPHALHHLVGHLCIFNDLGLHLSLSLRVGWWLGGCEMICGLSPYPQKMMRKWRNHIIIHYHLWMDGWMDGWYPKIFHSISSTSIANASEIWNPAPCGLSNAVAAGVPQLQQRAWRSIRSLANWEKMNSVSPVLDELWNYDLQRNEFPDPFQSSLHMTSGMHVWGPESLATTSGCSGPVGKFEISMHVRCLGPQQQYIMSFLLHQRDYT